MRDLDGRVAVVTGAASGIGRSLAGRLTVEGMHVVLADVEEGALRDAVAVALAANADAVAAGPLRLRITLTGGTSPLGSDRGQAGPTLVVALAPLTVWAPTAMVVVVPWTRNERAATAGLKTTSYADNVVALAHAKAHGGSEAVLANTAGMLCEGTGSNVFVVLAGELVTPPLTSGCLAGVTRALVLEWTGAVERDVPLGALLEADEVFLTSSTRDVQAVHAVGDDAYPDAPGPLTRQAAATFAERAAADVDP